MSFRNVDVDPRAAQDQSLAQPESPLLCASMFAYVGSLRASKLPPTLENCVMFTKARLSKAKRLPSIDYGWSGHGAVKLVHLPSDTLCNATSNNSMLTRNVSYL